MVSAQAKLRRPRVPLDVIFVAIFEGPARDYVEQIEPMLAAGDRIGILTIDQLRHDRAALKRCRDADLVLTFVHREAELRALVPDATILALRFIPSERTRQSLALVDPRSRVAAVTHFKDYIAIMRPSVREFAPHVSDITVTWSSARDLRKIIARCDVVVYASGADHVASLAGPSKHCFEYRHAPDPGVLETLLPPALAELRRGKLAEDCGPRGPRSGPAHRETKLTNRPDFRTCRDGRHITGEQACTERFPSQPHVSRQAFPSPRPSRSSGSERMSTPAPSIHA